MQRWIRFFLAIAVGLAGGLFYGWLISPVEYVDTSPDTLRIDYKSDYVLMTAEAYSVDGDLALAARRLAQLGDAPPEEIVRQAVLFAEKQEGYLDADVTLMRALLTALQTWTQPGEVNSP
jgi:hypothetical protein